MACKNCNPVAQKHTFATRGEVSRFIRKLRGLVEDGRITEFPSFTDLDRIEDDASYPDIIECNFGCPDCGMEFTFKFNSHKSKPPQWSTSRGRR